MHTFVGVLSRFNYNPPRFRSDVCRDIKAAQSTSLLLPGHEQDSRLQTAEWERQVEEVTSEVLQQRPLCTLTGCGSLLRGAFGKYFPFLEELFEELQRAKGGTP